MSWQKKRSLPTGISASSLSLKGLRKPWNFSVRFTSYLCRNSNPVSRERNGNTNHYTMASHVTSDINTRSVQTSFWGPTGGKAAGAWSYTSTLPYVFRMAWCLVKYRLRFRTFYGIKTKMTITFLDSYWISSAESLVLHTRRILTEVSNQWYSAELWAAGSGVRVPAGAGNFSLHHCAQIGSGAHPASYPMGTSSSFSWGKAARTWSWPLTSI
jgi:hypothetical protein